MSDLAYIQLIKTLSSELTYLLLLVLQFICARILGVDLYPRPNPNYCDWYPDTM